MAVRLDPVQNIKNVAWGSLAYFIGVQYDWTDQWDVNPGPNEYELPSDSQSYTTNGHPVWDTFLNFTNPENAPSIQQFIIPNAVAECTAGPANTVHEEFTGGPMYFDAAGLIVGEFEDIPRHIQEKVPPEMILRTSNGWIREAETLVFSLENEMPPPWITAISMEFRVQTFHIIIPSRFGFPMKEFDTGGDYWRLNLACTRNPNSILPSDFVPVTAYCGLYRPPPKENPLTESESAYTEHPAGKLEFVVSNMIEPMTGGPSNPEWNIELPVGLPSEERPIIITPVFA